MGKRASKPTSLRALEGGRSHSLPDPDTVHEPKPSPKAPPIPAELDADAKRTWRRLEKTLEPLGLLTQADGEKFAVLCQMRSRLKFIWKEINRLPRRKRQIETTLAELRSLEKTDDVKANITNSLLQLQDLVGYGSYLWKEERKYAELLRKYASDFGMSPRDRVGLSIVGSDEDDGASLLT